MAVNLDPSVALFNGHYTASPYRPRLPTPHGVALGMCPASVSTPLLGRGTGDGYLGSVFAGAGTVEQCGDGVVPAAATTTSGSSNNNNNSDGDSNLGRHHHHFHRNVVVVDAINIGDSILRASGRGLSYLLSDSPFALAHSHPHSPISGSPLALNNGLTYQGLVHGGKQLPPLTSSTLPAGSVGQKAVIRTSATAAVPSLSQVSPGSTVITSGGGATSGGSSSGNNGRTSSFAAALRKLAEQATEPTNSDKDQSPTTSPCPTPTSSKRAHSSSLVLAANSHSSSGSAHPHNLNSSFSSPPAVTIPSAPSQHGYIDEQKNLERPNVVQSREATKNHYEESRKSSHSNHRSAHSDVSREDGICNSSTIRSSSSSSYVERRDVDTSASKTSSHQGGYLSGHPNTDSASVKGPGSTPSSGYYGDRGREEHPFTVNGLTNNSHHLQQLRSQHHSTALTAPRLEDPHLSASSSFQPYRSTSEDVRHALPQPVPSTYDPASPYGYPAAFLPPHLSHPSFRLDDQMYLERLTLLRSPMFNLPHPGVLPPHHVMPFMPGTRYPAEFLAHPLSLVSPTGHHLLAQERLKLEEQQQRRERELELYQEQERRRECGRERERDKEKEQRESTSEGLVPREQDKGHKSHWQSSHPRRPESPVRTTGVGSITQGTPRDLVIRNSLSSSSAPRQVPTGASSSPPNLNSSGPDPFLQKPSLGLNSQPWGAHCFPRPPSTTVDQFNAEEGRDFDQDSVHSKAYPSIPYSQGHSPVSDHERSRDRVIVLDGQQTCDSTIEASTPSRSLQQLPFPSNSMLHLSSSSSISQRHYQPSDSPGFDRFHRVHLESMPSHEPFPASREASRQAVVTSHTSHLEGESERKANHHHPQYRADTVVTNHHVDHEIRAVTKSEPRPKSGAISRSRETVASASDTTELDNSVPWCSRFSLSGFPVDRSGALDGFGMANRCAAAPPGKSKLDLAAERARMKNRSIEEDWSEDDELSDKQRRSHLLTITSGPPLPLDASKGKLAFFSNVGLTTHKRRKEIEFDSYLRRAQRLRELGVSPVQHTASSETISIPWFLGTKSMSSRYNSDELGRESNFKEKVQFLQQLNLYSVPRSKREELEQILRVVIDEKIRRNGHIFPANYGLNHSFQRDENHPPNHHLNSAEFKDLVNKGTKRKVEESSVACANNEQPLSKRVKSLLASSRRKLSSLSGLNHSPSCGDLSGSRMVLPIAMGPTNKDSAALPCTLDGNLVSASVISYNNNNNKTDDDTRRSVRQLYGRDFAQEFHESVLLQTQQQQLKDSNRTGEVKLETKSSKESDPLLGSESIRHDASTVSPVAPVVTHDKHHRSSHSILRWPGIESLMEAYERHQQEQKLEKEVLLDQCSRLKAQNQDLSNIAEKLSQTMAELIHTKNDLDEERQRHHQAIDNLKCILKRLR